SLFFSLTRPPPPPTLFPYTTLFRSRQASLAPSTSQFRTWTATLLRSRTGRPFFGPSKTCRMAPESLALGTAMATTWHSSSRPNRSEEHTSELQSRENLVCRLLLEKK